MKQLSIGIVAMTLIFIGCTSTMEKKLNKEDFDKVKEEIRSNSNYSEMKKKYLIDNLTMQLGFAELGKAMNMEEENIPTFKEQINSLETDYDSIRVEKIAIREANKNLEKFVTLKNAKTTSIDKYNGYLNMTLDFNNDFEKEILYVVLNYSYKNDYDTEFFNSKVKVTDQLGKDFNSEIEVSTKEEYNDVAKFMYSEVPIRARKTLQDELGEEEANNKVERDFLMSGLKVTTYGIVFKDKSELIHRDSSWEYLE